MTALRVVVGLTLTLAIVAAGAAAVLFGVARDQPSVITRAEPDYATIERTARESTLAILSYEPDTVEQSLNKAKDLTTGSFKQQFSSLVDGIVIPGAKSDRITSEATVVAVGTESATQSKATVLTFVNQKVTKGDDAPSTTASSVKIGLVKVDDRWLIEAFNPA